MNGPVHTQENERESEKDQRTREKNQSKTFQR